MKTITEYQPLIFGSLISRAAKRKCRRHSTARMAAVGLPILYVVAGLKITVDTGLAVWDWRFWLMFVPLYLLGEQVLGRLAALADEARE